MPACSPSTPLRPVVPPYIFSHTFNYIMTTAFAGRMAFNPGNSASPGAGQRLRRLRKCQQLTATVPAESANNTQPHASFVFSSSRAPAPEPTI